MISADAALVGPRSAARRLRIVAFQASGPNFGVLGLGRARIQAMQLAEAALVVGKVFHPDFGLGADQTDRAHQGSAHVIGLCAEDVLYADPHGGFGPVAALGLFGQRFAPLALAVNVALQLPRAQLCFHLLEPIG